MKPRSHWLYWIALALLPLLACLSPNAEAAKTNAPAADTAAEPAKTNPDSLLAASYFTTALCDGFDYPFGNGEGGGSYTSPDGKNFDGWYIATHTGETYTLGVHTGEDWNGKGGGDTDLGQPVYATASGVVTASADFGAPWGNIIVVQHTFLENGKIRTVHSLYAHLDKRLAEKGDTLKRRQQLGTIGTGGGTFAAHLHFEIRTEKLADRATTYWPSDDGKDSKWVLEHYEKPSAFIDAHRKLTVPANEAVIVLAFKKPYRLFVYKNGAYLREFPLGLGQAPLGHKQKQGDNRTPEGEYRIIQKSRGPFTSGAYDAYLGVAWMRLNYPNNYDAAAGLEKKLISVAQHNSIVAANNAGKEPLKTTALGGGIGIHGWINDWEDNKQQNLTWGCISLRNGDLSQFYDLIPLQTKVIIVP